MRPHDDPADHWRWLQGIGHGDQDALAQLQRAFYARLWRYLWVQLHGDAAWIEEVLQDVFLAVWCSAASFHGDASLIAAWIFRIAHHQAAHAKRASFHRWKPHIIPFDDTAEESAATFEDETLQRLTFTDALAHLSLKHQEVLYLVFYQGFAPEEAAHILNVPLGTIKSRISYARRSLAQALDRPIRGGIEQHEP